VTAGSWADAVCYSLTAGSSTCSIEFGALKSLPASTSLAPILSSFSPSFSIVPVVDAAGA
jgi:hypothetical protein